MTSIDTGTVPAQTRDLVSVSVLKLALDTQQSAAAKLVEALQPPASSGGQVDVYA